MSDPLRDPRFADRPQTPDFWRLSSSVLRLDGATADGKYEQILDETVDLPSLIYLAEHRLPKTGLVLQGRHGATILAAYLDAFAVGVEFQKQGGHRPNETGTAGEGSSS